MKAQAQLQWRCAYCGEPVNDGCPDPSQFACCGEVGHVEQDKLEDEVEAQ